MIYFDNAATTHFKPQCVLDAAVDAMKNSFNTNRGRSREGAVLERKIFRTREAACALVGATGKHAVFSQNCTTALNLAVIGTARRGGHVIVTATEHNSVLRPVFELKNRGIVDVSVLYPDENGEITAEQIFSEMKSNTYLVALSHASNVTGKMQPVEKIGTQLKEKRPDVLFLCDCAQSVGYTLIEANKSGIDMLAFPTHKGLHGIQGCGVLIFDKDVPIKPIVFGGTGSESNLLLQPTTVPDGLEAGTLNTPAVCAAYAAMDWWISSCRHHMDNVRRLCRRLHEGLSDIAGVRLYSAPNDSGIVAFGVERYDSSVVADLLADKFDVCVRGGLHCAPLMHKHLGTLKSGLVRASVATDSSERECDEFLQRISDLTKNEEM